MEVRIGPVLYWDRPFFRMTACKKLSQKSSLGWITWNFPWGEKIILDIFAEQWGKKARGRFWEGKTYKGEYMLGSVLEEFTTRRCNGERMFIFNANKRWTAGLLAFKRDLSFKMQIAKNGSPVKHNGAEGSLQIGEKVLIPATTPPGD